MRRVSPANDNAVAKVLRFELPQASCLTAIMPLPPDVAAVLTGGQSARELHVFICVLATVAAWVEAERIAGRSLGGRGRRSVGEVASWRGRILERAYRFPVQ